MQFEDVSAAKFSVFKSSDTPEDNMTVTELKNWSDTDQDSNKSDTTEGEYNKSYTREEDNMTVTELKNWSDTDQSSNKSDTTKGEYNKSCTREEDNTKFSVSTYARTDVSESSDKGVNEQNITSNKEKEDDLQMLKLNYKSYSSTSKKAAYWAFFTKIPNNTALYYCIKCHRNPPRTANTYGVITYESAGSNNYNYSNLRNHCINKHGNLYRFFEKHVIKKGEKNEGNKLRKRKSYTSSNTSKALCGVDNYFLTVAKYPRACGAQLQFERNLCLLLAKCYLPFSVVDNLYFARYTLDLDPRLTIPTRNKLTNVLFPTIVNQTKEKYVAPKLRNLIGGTLSFDLWMSSKMEDIFSLNLHFVDNNWNVDRIQVGLPHVVQTDGSFLSSQIKEILHENRITRRIIAFVSDGGSNLVACSKELCSTITNSEVFDKAQQIFQVRCFAHIIQGACKNAILKAVTTRTVNLPNVKRRMQACVTWTKKSTKRAAALRAAQIHVGLKPQTLLTPVKTRFSYLIHSFNSLLKNRKAIEHLYGDVAESSSFRKCLPLWNEWEAVQMVVSTMESLVNSIILNQARGDVWLLSDAVKDMIELYILSSSVPQSVVEQIKKLKERYAISGTAPREVQHVANDLLTVSQSMVAEVQNQLKPFLKPMLEFDESSAHLFLALALDPRHWKMSLVGRLHLAVSGFSRDTAVSICNRYVDEVMIKLLLTIKGKGKPARMQHSERASDIDENAIFMIDTDDDMDLGDIKAELQHFKLLSKDILTEESPVQWWKRHQKSLVYMAGLAQLIYSIPPSQIENERDFSIAGVFARTRRNRLTSKNLERLVFVNKNYPNYDIQNLISKDESNTWKPPISPFDDDVVPDHVVDEMESYLEENSEI